VTPVHLLSHKRRRKERKGRESKEGGTLVGGAFSISTGRKKEKEGKEGEA